MYRRLHRTLTTWITLARTLACTVALLLHGASSGERRNAGRPARLTGSRGDVPGWVMVTLMSALLVAGIYAVAGPALINMFTNAINKVGGLR